MSSIEVVTIEVGSAIAKSILKIWLKGSNLAEDASSSIIDILKSQTANRLAQQQCEKIGDRVGENLLPLFEAESRQLDEGSRTAVALAVAETFNTSKITSDLLAKHNLEPTELAKHILSADAQATQLFSTVEMAFYQRIIEVSCTYIIDIASQLPTFTGMPYRLSSENRPSHAGSGDLRLLKGHFITQFLQGT